MKRSEVDHLLNAARDAAKNAYAPYSKYPVGAAVETADGEVFIGCNLESSTYGLTVCAERNAIASAVVKGHKKFKALAIWSLNSASPCGACRQVIWDICGDIPVYLSDAGGNFKEYHSAELLPYPFDDTNLKEIKQHE